MSQRFARMRRKEERKRAMIEPTPIRQNPIRADLPRKILLTRCEIAVFITEEMRDDEKQTQALFDDIYLALGIIKRTIAPNIRDKYPYVRVEVQDC